jgi:acetyltransferase-like isoleucine patch superfamily enzyme
MHSTESYGVVMLKKILRRLCLSILNLFPATQLYALKRTVLRCAGFNVGSNVRVVSSCRFYVPRLSLGDNTWVGHQVLFVGGDANVLIGRNVDIGPRVVFATGSHKLGEEQHRAGYGYSSSIEIGDGVWIGSSVTILGGVSVGYGAVIAAGALVRQDVPPNVLVAGVPARVIRTL